MKEILFDCENVKMKCEKNVWINVNNEEKLGVGKVYIFHGSALLDTTTLLMYRTDSLLPGVSCLITE